MDNHDLRELLDTLETARIHAGAEMEKLCNSNKYIDACVFQSIRDSIYQNIQLLESYINCKTKREVQEYEERE